MSNQNQPGIRTRDTTMRLRVVLVLAWSAGLLLCRPLWLSSRYYPHTPFLTLPVVVPTPLDTIIFLCVLLLSTSIAFPHMKGLSTIFLGSVLGLCILDQSRLQPWVYQYALMTGALLVHHSSSEHGRALRSCQFIVATIYAFAGLHKLNAHYFSVIYPWFIGPAVDVLPHYIGRLVNSAGLITPFIEVSIGIGLLISRVRLVAVSAALLLHILTIAVLGPWGHDWNSVAWPWNVAMMAFVVILFRKPHEARMRDFLPQRGSWYYTIVFVLCGVMPVLSFVNLWNPFLSAALYSGDMVQGAIRVEPRIQDTLPPPVRASIREPSGLVYILDWSYKEMNVPPYPSTSVARNVARSLCTYQEHPGDLELLIEERPDWVTGRRRVSRYSCEELEK